MTRRAQSQCWNSNLTRGPSESLGPSILRGWIMTRLRAALISSCALLWLTSFALSAAAQSAVSFSPTSLSFGYVLAGQTSQPQTVTLTNTGNATLNITSISITGTDPQDFSQTNNCGSQVSAAGHCTIT